MGLQDFTRLRQECLSKGVLWEDPDFEAEDTNIFYHNRPAIDFKWKRPKEMVSNPRFVIDSRSQYDIVTGTLGESYLVSVLGVLYQYRGLFYRCVPADQGFESDYSYSGIFHFRLWWAGEWTEVLVDDRLPTINGELAFIHSEKTNQFWAALLEKAYAKLHGSYESLKYTTSADAFNELTGGTCEKIPLSSDEMCQKLLGKAIKQTAIISTVTKTEDVTDITPDRHFNITAFEELECIDGTTAALAKIQNSPGLRLLYEGPWSNGRSGEWRKVHPRERERIGFDRLNNGEFWMPWDEFKIRFERLELTFLDADTCQSETKFKQAHIQPPHTRIFQGFWKRGITAGGCRNHIETFHLNPQVLLGLSHTESVVITLIQHQILEPRTIGFTVYKVTGSPPNNQLLSSDFFRTNKAINHSEYTNSRQVIVRMELETGNYVVIPTTYDSNTEGTFTMRVFSQAGITLGVLDSLPSVLKPAIIKATAASEAYKSMFLSFADEKKMVNSYELQELLHSSLPNDYIKSCASLDVCRRAIQALNPSQQLGRMGYSHFKDLIHSLKLWQEIFGSYSKTTSGIMKAERFREALADVGFRLSTDIMHVLLLRYMRRDGTLRFGDFVSAILHLVVAFNTFSRRAKDQSDSVELNSKDWMKSVLRC